MKVGSIKKASRLNVASLLAFFVLLLVACGNNDSAATEQKASESNVPSTQNAEKGTEPQEKVKLKLFTYIGEDSRLIPHEYAMAKMKELMPNVDVTVEMRVGDDSKLETYAAINSLPDMFETDANTIATFKKSNQLLELDKYLKELKVEEKMVPVAKSRLWDKDGHSYAMPMDGQHSALIYYNKKLFKEQNVKVPENYDEFLQAVKAFDSKGIVPMAFFSKEKWPGIQFYDILVSRQEPKGLKKINDGEGEFTEDAYKQAAIKFHELVKAGIVAKGAFTSDYSAAYSMFTNNKAAMFMNGSWAMGDLAKDMGENVDYLGYPLADTTADSEAAKYTMSGGNTIGGHSVAANTKYPDIAAKWLIQYSMELSRGAMIKTGNVSQMLDENIQPEKPYAPIQSKYLSEVPRHLSNTVFPWGLDNTVFNTAIGDNVARLMIDKKYTPDEFVNDMQGAVQSSRK